VHYYIWDDRDRIICYIGCIQTRLNGKEVEVVVSEKISCQKCPSLKEGMVIFEVIFTLGGRDVKPEKCN